MTKAQIDRKSGKRRTPAQYLEPIEQLEQVEQAYRQEHKAQYDKLLATKRRRDKLIGAGQRLQAAELDNQIEALRLALIGLDADNEKKKRDILEKLEADYPQLIAELRADLGEVMGGVYTALNSLHERAAAWAELSEVRKTLSGAMADFSRGRFGRVPHRLAWGGTLRGSGQVLVDEAVSAFLVKFRSSPEGISHFLARPVDAAALKRANREASRAARGDEPEPFELPPVGERRKDSPMDEARERGEAV